MDQPRCMNCESTFGLLKIRGNNDEVIGYICEACDWDRILAEREAERLESLKDEE